MVLKSISDPKKRVKIEIELSQIYPHRRVHYNKEYKELLKGLCEKYGYNVSKQSIIKELTKALTYSENYTRLSKDKKKELNEDAKLVIDKLKI